MQPNKLFEIDSIINDFETRTITVNVEPNNYVGNHVMIDFDEFAKYLDKHDYLYYETHDFSTGQYVNKGQKISIEQYLENVDYDYYEEDLYDYILSSCINWRKATRNILIQSNSILNQLN